MTKDGAVNERYTLRGQVTVEGVGPDLPDAQTILRDYFEELVARYQGRPATTDEISAAMLEFPSEDLQPPTGQFLVAYAGGDPIGCAGLRFRSTSVGQVTRMFVIVEHRRRGLGQRLLEEVESVARARGLTRLELDTRDDLIEARRLYLRFGFEEVPAFNDGPYAEHWYAKSIERSS
jgi:GNAT superfamily N-acetyltransferase